MESRIRELSGTCIPQARRKWDRMAVTVSESGAVQRALSGASRIFLQSPNQQKEMKESSSQAIVTPTGGIWSCSADVL